MVQVSKAIQRLSGSQRAKKLAKPPSSVLSLASGDPDFDTPEHIREAAIAAIRGGLTHYPAVMGDPELRAAVAAHLSTLGGGAFKSEDVLITAGSASGIYAAIMAYLDPGDEVLLHDPTYSLYADVALSIGGVPVFVPWTHKLRLDIDAMERAITPKTRMFILNNPVNPTGVVFTPTEMREIVDFVRRHDLVLISDEAYDHLVYDGRPMISTASFEEIADRTITINTCSKTFAMTGWRIGYTAARDGLIKGPAMMQRTMLHTVNAMTQRAVLAAYTIKTDWPERMLAEYTRRRDLMCELVNAMPGLECERPEGAFYVFVKVATNISSEELTAHCVGHGVTVRSGTEFGPRGEGYIRLTFAGDAESFKPALERLEKAMHAL